MDSLFLLLLFFLYVLLELFFYLWVHQGDTLALILFSGGEKFLTFNPE